MPGHEVRSCPGTRWVVALVRHFGYQSGRIITSQQRQDECVHHIITSPKGSDGDTSQITRSIRGASSEGGSAKKKNHIITSHTGNDSIVITSSHHTNAVIETPSHHHSLVQPAKIRRPACLSFPSHQRPVMDPSITSSHQTLRLISAPSHHHITEWL